MALVSNTTVNSKTASEKPEDLQSILNSFSAKEYLSPTTSSAVSGTATKTQKNSTTTILNTAVNLIKAELNPDQTNKTDKTTTKPAGSSSYLNIALKSVTAMFSGSNKSLASAIDKNLSKIFDDTNNKNNSTTVTKISDPVATNLTTKKTPDSSLFKISSLVSGSEAKSGSGFSTEFGSNSKDMIGTILSTVLNRMDLDKNTDSQTVANQVSNENTQFSLSSLFSKPDTLSAKVESKQTTPQDGKTEDRITAIAKDIGSFIAKATNLSSTSGKDPLNHITIDNSKVLIDQDGNDVACGTNVDEGTANSLLALARVVGCSTQNDGTEYYSASSRSSMFDMLVSSASEYGMRDLLDDLLGCSSATSDTGQYSISSAYDNAVGNDATIAGVLLGAITNKSVLNTPERNSKTVSNPFLKASDVALIDSIFSLIGTSTDEAYQINDMPEGVVVYDTGIIKDSSPSFTDAHFGDKVLTTYTLDDTVFLGEEDIMLA